MDKLARFLAEEKRNSVKTIKKNIKKIGPGVITGGSDNDPGGIVTYTTVGATTGFSLLWLLLLTTPMMIVVQEMAARIAIIKKKGLASIVKEYYGTKIAVAITIILAIANIATIAADIAGLSAVLGMLTGINWIYFILPIVLLIWYIIVFKKYKLMRNILLVLTLTLVVYIFAVVLAAPSAADILKGFIPNINFSFVFLAAAVALIGTTISPYLLFWQASDELEEHKTILRAKDMEWDTTLGMVWSNLIAAFIIIAAAATIFGKTGELQSVQQAASVLKPFAGNLAYLFFTLGIIFSGFLAIPVLIGSTSYAFAEIFGFKEGFNKKPNRAKQFYIIVSICAAVGALIALLPINPVKFLFYTQVLDGLLMPFLVVVLITLCNNKKIMGTFVNTKWKNFFAVLLTAILSVLDVFLIIELIKMI